MDVKTFNQNIRGLRFLSEGRWKWRSVFFPNEGVIAKVSRHHETYPGKICFIRKVHSGCMGDCYDVFISAKDPHVTVNWVEPAGFFSTLWFLMRNFRKNK